MNEFKIGDRVTVSTNQSWRHGMSGVVDSADQGTQHVWYGIVFGDGSRVAYARDELEPSIPQQSAGSVSIEALRNGLSPLALEWLDAAIKLGRAANPAALHHWSLMAERDQLDKGDTRRADAARELADRIVAVALRLAAWR